MHNIAPKAPVVPEAQKIERDRIKNLALAVFDNAAGKELLSYFKSKTIEQSSFNFNLSGDMQLSHAAKREGENGIVRQMLKLAEPRKSAIDKPSKG